MSSALCEKDLLNVSHRMRGINHLCVSPETESRQAAIGKQSANRTVTQTTRNSWDTGEEEAHTNVGTVLWWAVD